MWSNTWRTNISGSCIWTQERWPSSLTQVHQHSARQNFHKETRITFYSEEKLFTFSHFRCCSWRSLYRIYNQRPSLKYLWDWYFVLFSFRTIRREKEILKITSCDLQLLYIQIHLLPWCFDFTIILLHLSCDADFDYYEERIRYKVCILQWWMLRLIVFTRLVNVKYTHTHTHRQTKACLLWFHLY